MADLFFDSIPLTFEKTAAEVALPDDPNTWMYEVLQELHKAVPYVADFDVRVVMQRVDAEKGYGIGHFEVTSKTDLQPDLGSEKLRAAGVATVQVPILIRDRRLKPIDLLVTPDGKMMPLTEDRLRRALFRPHPFDTIETSPGDTTMVGQLYPPNREAFGLGGGVMSSGGWSKTGSAKEEFEAWVTGEKTASVKDIAAAAAMKGEEVAKEVRKDALDYWKKWGGDGTGGTGGVRVGIDKDPDRDFESRKEQHVAKPMPQDGTKTAEAPVRMSGREGAWDAFKGEAPSALGATIGAVGAGYLGVNPLSGAGIGYGVGALPEIYHGAKELLAKRKGKIASLEKEAISLKKVREVADKAYAASEGGIPQLVRRTPFQERLSKVRDRAYAAGDKMYEAGRHDQATKRYQLAEGLNYGKEASDLTQSAREHIKDKNFALPKADGPGDTGKYPIHDKDHARSALGLVGMHGTDSEKARVRAEIAQRYPELLQKKADLNFERKGGVGEPKLTSIGWFVGGADEDHEPLTRRQQELLREHGSMRKAREALAKERPDLYQTMASVMERSPEGPGLLRRIVTFGGASKAHAKALSEYEQRAAHPAVFLHAAPAGSPAQHEFYADVARGRMDPKFTQNLFKEKTSSLLSSILPTINAADFDEVVSAFETDSRVKAAYQNNARAGACLDVLSQYDPPSLRDREEAIRKVAGYDVFQIRRLGGGEYLVKKAHSGAWEPISERINRGQLYLEYGEKVAADVDMNGSVTSASGKLVETDSPEADRPEQINRFGLYRVQDKQGNDLIGYVFPNLLDTDGKPLPIALFTNGSASAVQSDIAGVRVDSGVNISEGRVIGHGSFVRVLPNGRAEATIPYELQAELAHDGEMGYLGEAFDGRPVKVMVQHGLQRIAEIDGTVLIPDTFRWMPLRGGAVELVENANGFDKKASSNLFLRGDGAGGFNLEGAAVHGIPESERSFLSAEDAMFVLAGAGVHPKLAHAKIKRAFVGDAPIPIPSGRTVKSATALRKEAFQRVLDRGSLLEAIKSPIFLKEAATLSDPDTIDAVLSMGFLNDENLLTFIDFLPKLEEAQGKLCALLLASRMGLSVVPEEAVTRLIPNLEKTIAGLKMLAFHKN